MDLSALADLGEGCLLPLYDDESRIEQAAEAADLAMAIVGRHRRM
jgi:hypothetical protein